MSLKCALKVLLFLNTEFGAKNLPFWQIATENLSSHNLFCWKFEDDCWKIATPGSFPSTLDPQRYYL